MGEFEVFEKFKEQVVVIDKDYKIVYANESYVKENGYRSKEEVVGKPCYLVSHKRDEPCDGECHPCPLKEIQKRKGAVSVVHTHYTHDNKEVHVEICAFPIEEGRKIIQFIKNIKNDKEKFYLFSLSQKLSSVGYLALGVAHQLNTPLATISLALEELEKKCGSCEEIEVIKNALISCKNTVDKLLLFARKDNNKDLVDTKKAVEDVLELLRVYAKERGVIIEKELESVYMFGNETDIRHVVLNLVLNAIQASDRGKKVRVFLKKEGEELILIVEDEGKGIPPEEVDKIFLPFYHGKDKREGSGLGLAIVNDIVKSYGGKINLRSAPGKGSIFEVHLPLS
ncbi:sensor histidine kinase [Aquifex aeolicus]|uniref:histidine kinase n=1 Tax=Aquifex aeolicus (strain VF5) TaxID=224324 RepID=O66597_AQUAE|nr:PAS domain-containing sensor histidine kinase [Aquifex aeolicus]AAC06560.1 histidine kinase sensor protein [Aquifex aeolicus VF5]